MGVYYPYYIRCSNCAHRNILDRSPRLGIRKALLGEVKACKGCGKQLHPQLNMQRPMMRQIANLLQQQGFKLATGGEDIDWAPPRRS